MAVWETTLVDAIRAQNKNQRPKRTNKRRCDWETTKNTETIKTTVQLPNSMKHQPVYQEEVYHNAILDGLPKDLLLYFRIKKIELSGMKGWTLGIKMSKVFHIKMVWFGHN